MMETKIKGIQETLKNLLVEGDLSPQDALHAITHYLLDLSEDHPKKQDQKKILDACVQLKEVIENLKTVESL